MTLQNESRNMIYSSPNKSLQAPTDQDIREMRHHVHCKEHNGVVGFQIPTARICTPAQSAPLTTLFLQVPPPLLSVQPATLQLTPQLTQQSI